MKAAITCQWRSKDSLSFFGDGFLMRAVVRCELRRPRARCASAAPAKLRRVHVQSYDLFMCHTDLLFPRANVTFCIYP